MRGQVPSSAETTKSAVSPTVYARASVRSPRQARKSLSADLGDRLALLRHLEIDRETVYPQTSPTALLACA